MAHGFWLQAEYESGYVITEDDVDHSPFDPGRNVFHAILNNRPTDHGHGRMTRFAMVPWDPEGKTFEINWVPLWEVDNPRPIYCRVMHKTDELADDGTVLTDTAAVCDMHKFGYQFNDADGKNVQEVVEITMGEV